ncbi:MAG TPA: hypothetical protein VFX22_09205, partial [Candidatus Kapabacteria bacterium]|nr:hypothetical protein [Candidatus Kapabacteria bacterium]
YAESQGGDANRIDLKTTKSVSIKPREAEGEEKLRWNWNTPIVTGTANTHDLYMGAQFLYRSTNQGRTWDKISPDLTTNNKAMQQQDSSGGLSTDNTAAENHCTIFTIAESPLDDKTIWVGTDDGNLQVTTNAGKTWKNVAANVAAGGVAPQAWVSSIEPSRFDKNTVYATFDNHMTGDMKTYLAKSTDFGTTWKMISSSEFTGYAHKIKEDLVNKNLLFLGTEMGLFATLDGGENWFRMKNNIPWYVAVRDIQIQPKTNDLVLATHGRGVIVVDDITPMRSLTKDIIDRDVYLIPSPPILLSDGVFGYGGASSPGGWVADNAAYTEIPPIQYYLRDRVNTARVKVEIFDSTGALIQSIPASERKGINKIHWNLRMKPPKTAIGGTKIDYAGFTGPMVMPGVYTVKLTIGTKEYTSPLTLLHDTTNKNFTLNDRKLQYDLAMQCYHLHERLASVVDNINDKQKWIKAMLDSVKDEKVRKALTEYDDSLEKLRTTLLASKQTSVFADERKLRENISEVYTDIAYNEARPSNLQMDRVKMLEERVANADANDQAINAKYKLLLGGTSE